jgi:DNA-binding transcriptional LysR family regulator
VRDLSDQDRERHSKRPVDRACIRPGIVTLPAYVCKRELRSGELTRVLPGWLAGESTFTALLPHRRGLLPAVRIFVDYLARYLPNAVSGVLASRVKEN